MFYITTKIKRTYTWEYAIYVWHRDGWDGLVFANEVKVTSKNNTGLRPWSYVDNHYDGCGLSFNHQGLAKLTKAVWQFQCHLAIQFILFSRCALNGETTRLHRTARFYTLCPLVAPHNARAVHIRSKSFSARTCTGIHNVAM